MKRILFIDRDGIILKEPESDYQIDSIGKKSFVPGAITNLARIAEEFDFYTVMISNQDGLGTPSFPEEKFFPFQNLMIRTLEAEGFSFNEVCIDRSFEHEQLPTRKPGTGLIQHLNNNPDFDIANSYVIGDRHTDILLAKNIGCKAIWLQGLHVIPADIKETLLSYIALEAKNWKEIYQFLKLGLRTVMHKRITSETAIDIHLNVDGSSKSNINTGLGFFNHMLEQIARHGKMDLSIITKGDLEIDEHHTIEDTGIALGEAFAKALSDKTGMERYGFALPMDDAEAKVLIDFGGRNWIVWDAEFKREKIGDVPTEMFFHFFKSFSDAAKCNLNISCSGSNEHHKIEAIFKAFAKAIKMAVKKDPFSNYLPTTKGVI
jgi:imidazoleglycerol-phosphate dehydratase / histidinol-phosphatase